VFLASFRHTVTPVCGVQPHYVASSLNLVEAAGVEPASEKAHRAKPTCVSGSGVSAIPYKTGKSENRLVRLISAHGSGPKPGAYPAK
jgi:hypothetical protein